MPDSHWDASRFGEDLRRTRKVWGLNLRKAAAEAGVSFNTFSRVERGRGAHIDSVAVLAYWAGLSLDRYARIGVGDRQ